MKIFRVSHITLHYCGILDDKNLSNVLSKFIQSVVILSSTYFVISASMFFVGNISDILTATEGVYLTGAALVTLLLLLDYKLNRHLIYKFIFDLQENINRDLTREAIAGYSRAENLSNQIATALFRILAVVSTTSFLLPPALSFVLNRINMKFEWSMPSSLRYLFGTEESNRNYVIVYVCFMLGGYSVAFMFFVTNVFFITASLHIIAIFQELRGSYRTTDSILKSKDVYCWKQEYKLFNCIAGQQNAYRLLDQLSEIIKGVKFIIIIFGVSMLCTTIFQIEMTTDFSGEIQKLIQCTALCMANVATIFVHCYLGEKIREDIDISDTIYNLSWYEYPLSIRSVLLFALARSQRVRVFLGAKSSHLTLDNFTNIIRLAAQILAVLKSIK